MRTSNFRLAIAGACAAVVIGCASQRPAPPAEWDGLEKRDVKGVGLVYVRPNVHFPPYNNVILDPVQVEFSKDWDPNPSNSAVRRLDAQDLAKIKDSLGTLVRDGFAQELSKGGYKIVDAPADDTIRVTAAIINLYINAPDVQTAGRSRTYTTDAGSMTLLMEVRDAPSGQLLARVVDPRHADTGSTLQWTNSVTNRADAERLIRQWADKFRAALDRLKVPTQ